MATGGTKRFEICLLLIAASFFFSFWLFKHTPVKREVVERITEKVKEVTPDNPCKGYNDYDARTACEIAYTCKMQNGRLIEYKGDNDFKCEYVQENKTN